MIRQERELRAFLESGPCVEVRIAEAKGSSPREAGTYMLVSWDGIYGTIGGGQLEFMAIDHARAMLAGKRVERRLDIPLGPGIGQCCGGHVSLEFELVSQRSAQRITEDAVVAREAWHRVYVFGAGHVGRALSRGLQNLPLSTFLVDTRQSELDLVDAEVETIATPLPEAVVAGAPEGSAFIAVTHDHALDFLITSAALDRGDAAYVGMIGSKTKRAQFLRWAQDAYDNKIDCSALVCPIGGNLVVDKRPEIIAALTIAELIGKIDQYHCPNSRASAQTGQVYGGVDG